MKKILWATDFSGHAHDAGLRALECSRCAEGHIDVLTVVDPEELPPIVLDVPDPFIAEEAVHEAERRLEADHEEQIRLRLEEETRFLVDAGLEVSLHVRVGRPSDQILAAARELGSDLIVMGAHGHRSLEALLLGSTVERVTRHADCPVMVVR